MSNYALTDNVKDEFRFDIRGKVYAMRYPTTQEIQSIQEISSRIEEAQESKNLDEVKELSSQLEEKMYEFITPIDHDLPVKEALKTENTRVMRNFNHMVKTELSIQ